MSTETAPANIAVDGTGEMVDGHLPVWSEDLQALVDGGDPTDVVEGATAAGLRTDVDKANHRDTLVVVGNAGATIAGHLAGVYDSVAATADVTLTLPALAGVKGESAYVLAPAAHETILTAHAGDTINGGASVATDVGAIVQIVAGNTGWRTIGPLD